VRLPDGSVRLVQPEWMGKLDGFTLLFEALVLTLCREMTFAAVARLVNLSWYRVKAICDRYVDLAVAATDLCEVTAVAIDETSCRRGHDYVSLVADMDGRRVVFVTPGKDAGVVERFANHLEEHHATPAQIKSVSIDMSPAFIKGVDEHLPDARVTFDKFHVIAHASKALDGVRREQQKTDPALKGMRWSLLKDADKLNLAQLTDLEALISQYTTNRTAPCLDVPRAAARDSRSQADPRCLQDVATVVHWRHAFQGRTHEGRRTHDPSSFRRHRRVGPDAPDQWLH